MSVDRDRERVHFTCHRCAITWGASYEVARWQDHEGGTVEVYSQYGFTVPSPRSGPSCPCCGWVGVQVETYDVHAPITPPTPRSRMRGAGQARALLEPRVHRFP